MAGRQWLNGILMALVAVVLVLTVACQGTALPTPAESPLPVPSLVVLDAVTSRRVGSDYAPIDVTFQFSPTDTFYCIIQVADVEQDTEFVARWYFGDALITETTYVTEEQGTGYVAFELTNQKPWPVGLYRVEVLAGEAVLCAVEFQVVT